MKENKRFLRNILVATIALMIVAVIVNIAPGYKRDKFFDVTNLIITDENVTEKLVNPICFDNTKNIYISMEDVRSFLDSTIYYDDATNKVIMSSNTKVASMEIGQNKINLNGIEMTTLVPATNIQNIIYLPIQELTEVYNIDIEYRSNSVIIDFLSKSLVSADVSEEVVLRYKARSLSKAVATLSQGQSVYCFYTTSRGWRIVRTEDGKIGYIKANKLANEYVLRQDMDIKNDAETLNISLNNGNIIEVNNKKVVIRDMPKLTSNNLETSEYDVWLNVKNDLSEDEMNKIFDEYDKRTEFINNIVNYAMKSEVKAVNIDMSAINVNDNFTRFLLELAPRLRDIGILTNVVKGNGLQEDLIKARIDYLIQKQ